MPPDVERDPFEGPTWVDRFLLPFAREPLLWPILLVLVGHAIAFIAPLLLLSFRDGSWFWGGALLLLVGITVAGIRFEVRTHRRPGALSGILLSTWALSGVGAWIADHYDIF